MLAALEFFDLAIILAMLIVFASSHIYKSVGTAAMQERLRRLEDKINFLIAQHGAEYAPKSKARWQRLAEEGQRSAAIEEYKNAHHVSDNDAQEVVGQYLEDFMEL